MMAQCDYRGYRNHSKVYRSSANKVFAGVCGGLGEHFDVSATWLRVGFIVGTALTFPVAPILYAVCIFLMPSLGGSTRSRRGYQRDSAGPAVPHFRSKEAAMDHLSHQFDEIEKRIRGLEDHVTSREYVLKRKFEEL